MLNHLILLVEDDEDDRTLLLQGFTDAGYSGDLKFVHSGEAALKYLQTLSPPFYPSLIVLDFNTPGLNGAEILGQIKKLEKIRPLPVVFYSHNMRPLVRELLLAAGATACLEKPTTTGGVREVVRSLLTLAQGVASLRP